MTSDQTSANLWTPDQLRFQAWLALPSAARSPKSQQKFAAEIRVHETTLCNWKRLPGWHDAVYALALSEVIGELVPVLQAQVREAKKGSLPHAQWLFEVAGKWTPRSRIDHGNASNEPFVVEVKARDYREALGAFLPPSESTDA